MPYIETLDDAKSEIARLLVQCGEQRLVIDSHRAFRAEVAAALPSTWYADRPVEFRVKMLVEQWEKLMIIHHTQTPSLHNCQSCGELFTTVSKATVCKRCS